MRARSNAPDPATPRPWHVVLLTGLFFAFWTHASLSAPLRVAVISDLNGDYGSTAYSRNVDTAIARIIDLHPDLVISTGDMVAGQRRPHLTRAEIERMWVAFHAHVSAPLAAAGLPLAVTPGNHDGSAYRGFALERAIYGEQWRTRKPAVQFVDDAHYPYYYAFVVQGTLFIGLDATVSGRLPAAQSHWLTGILSAPPNGARVVFSHVPLWPFAIGREQEFIGDKHLESALHDAGVALYLSGHHHAFFPGAKDGIGYVGQACLGTGPRRLIGTTQRSAASFTLLEFEGPGIRVAAYAAPDFAHQVEWSTLPERIHSAVADLQRADLAASPLKRLAR